MDELTPNERKKIMEIMKEKERNVPNMDWMYTKAKADTDDYLLGKKVDKHFEKPDEPEETIPQGDVFGERIKANITLDMQAKMREDPLFAIKKVEEESRRKLLHNPIKMKQLKKMIEQQQKAAKKKKQKKHKHRKDNSDSEDDDLISKYLSILNQKHMKNPSSEKQSHLKGDKSHKKSSKHFRGDNSKRDNSNHSRKDRTRTRSGSLESDRCREDHERSKRNRLKDRTEEQSESEGRERKGMSFPSDLRRRQDSSSGEDVQPKAYGLIKMNSQPTTKHEISSRSSRSRSPTKSTRKQSPDIHRSSHRHHSRSPRLRSRSPNRSSRKESGRRDKIAPSRSRSPVKSRPRGPSPKKKLTAEERAEKLAEMMDNAKWREDQRKSNVKHYEQEDRKEEEMEKKGRGSGAKFLNPMLSKHASESSVEDRLKRNKYNIQRRKTDLERNFTEK